MMETGGHVKDGHRVLYTGTNPLWALGSAKVLTDDPCPFGLPEIFTVAHMSYRQY